MDSPILDIFVGGGLAMLILEGLKWIFRNWIIKNPEYEFHPNVYLVAIPVLNALLIPLAAFLGVEGATMPTDWVSFGKMIVVLLIQSLVTVLIYENTLKPMKAYGEKRAIKG